MNATLHTRTHCSLKLVSKTSTACPYATLDSLSISGRMAMPLAQVVTPQSSRLLAIPGGKRLSSRPSDLRPKFSREIGNRIYGLAVDGALLQPKILSQPFSHDQSHPERLTRTNAGAHFPPHEWHLLQKSFLGLTQVCRQLRKELLPIHQSQITFIVSAHDLQAYVTTFVVDLKIARAIVRTPRSRIINIRDILLRCA